jgi:superfamily II DNA or RNA helicase
MSAAASLSLFDWAATPRVAAPIARADDTDGLRPYQLTAAANARAELGRHRSTLVVMPTGTGKTQTFGSVAKRWPGRVLVLAHREELIDQARGRLVEMTGEYVGTEQAAWRAQSERLVVGSVQTLRPGRLARFARDHFSLVIVDEAHHAVARTYRAVLDHFDGAKVLGVTATPDRADESAMGQVFESVAFVYDIQDAIRDGYLVPITCQMVHVAGVDLSAVKTVAGDLNQGQLDAVMASEEALHGIARPTLELAGDRRTILFTTSVDNAHRLAEVLNRYRPGSARAIDGGTAPDLRKATLAGHKRGDFQFLCNVQVLTEGYDDPGVACIAMGRPTKSRALYTQCIGRGLRPAPGKTDCLVLDFAGNSGRHKLVSALDILAGKWPEDVVARAKEEAERGAQLSAEEALEKAARELENERQRAAAKRARIKAEVRWQTRTIDPFAVLGVRDRDDDGAGGRQPITPGQVTQMEKFSIDVPQGCTRAQASRLISAAIARRRAGLSTYKQARKLSRYGVDASRMYMTTASKVLDAISSNGWHPISPAEVNRIVNSREVGEDG